MMDRVDAVTELDIPDIIRELTPYTGRFPRQALEAAIARPNAITPHLLEALEKVAKAPAEFARREDFMLHMFAVYLLAQFRERRSYPLLVEILAAPGNTTYDLFGDTISEMESWAEFENRSEPDWPPLPPEDQRLVQNWRKEVWPVYAGKGGKEQWGWLLERTLAFLDQQPRLFRYLYLHEEFLFEVGGALARAGRMEDYLALLLRLRREAPEAYFPCFGYYDHDLIAEALRTGRREGIPDYLDLFRQHPVNHIDEFADVVNLLAWRGCEMELRTLLEPTAQTISDSPDVLGGTFGLLWLTHLAMIPFLEAGDDPAQSIDQLCQATAAVGYLEQDSASNRNWLRRAVRLAAQSPAEAGLDLKRWKNEAFQDEVGWNFTGWVRRSKGLSWTSARFLAHALLNYWGWNDPEEKKPARPFGLNEKRLDHYLAQGCRDFIRLKPVQSLSTLQALHYFTEYLVAQGYFNAAEAGRWQSVAARFFETLQDVMDVSDPTSGMFPTYAALVAGPELASTSSLPTKDCSRQTGRGPGS
jgi:Protein of unknown function (DUF1186)